MKLEQEKQQMFSQIQLEIDSHQQTKQSLEEEHLRMDKLELEFQDILTKLDEQSGAFQKSQEDLANAHSELKAKENQHKKQISDLTRKLKEVEENLAQSETTRGAVVGDMEEEIHLKDETIHSLEEEIISLRGNAEVIHLKGVVDEKDDEINDLILKCNDLLQKNQRLVQINHALEAKITVKQPTISNALPQLSSAPVSQQQQQSHRKKEKDNLCF